jgi:hypothetical protein
MQSTSLRTGGYGREARDITLVRQGAATPCSEPERLTDEIDKNKIIAICYDDDGAWVLRASVTRA